MKRIKRNFSWKLLFALVSLRVGHMEGVKAENGPPYKVYKNTMTSTFWHESTFFRNNKKLDCIAKKCLSQLTTTAYFS
jgi:hypothetical protein